MERTLYVQAFTKKGLVVTKLLFIMRLTSILMLTATLQVSARSFSQNITISSRKITLENVFKQIKEQTGISFLWNENELDKDRTINIDVHDASLQTVLDICLRGLPLFYKIRDMVVLLERIPETQAETPSPSPPLRLPPPVNIHGKITDEKGNPLPGVTIRNKKKEITTASVADGTYSANGEKGDVLIFSHIGYKTQEVPVPAKMPLDVIMVISTSNLDEVVMVGYGSTKKRDLTGSTSTIDIKDIQDVPFMTIDNALAGKAAGVEVTKTDGTPGGAVRIRVRGSTSLLGGNDPLYVIDGVQLQVQSNYINPGFDVTTAGANSVNTGSGISAGMSAGFVNGLNSIGSLNIDDIESITILKDAASTAIYGSKAANGVVIITTKKGKKDMKPQIMFSYYGTYTTPIQPKLLNGAQYKMLLTEAAQNDYNYHQTAGTPASAQVDAIVNTPDTYFGNANTNWLNQVTRKTYSNNAEISVQGGGSASKYYTSISYNTTPGTVDGSTYQRVAGKMNMENEIGKHLRFLTNLDMGYVEQNITNGAYTDALTARPDLPPYDSTGNFTSFASVGGSYLGFQNPRALLGAINNAKTLSLLGSISGIYDFTPALEFKSTASLNLQDYNQRNYTPSYLVIGGLTNDGGIGANSNSRLNNWFVENTLTFDKTFHQKHALNLLAGTSFETDKSSFFSATATGYPNDNVLNTLSSAVLPVLVQGDDPSKPQSYMISYYLRANYGFMDKYLFTFTGRADGSSKFGPDNKYGYFPSGAIAWRISKENFLKNISWIDDIKFRSSYGVTGTQDIGNQMYRTLYTPYAYAGTSALIPTQLGNPAIQWETTDETDEGLDFSFFKERLQGTFDYYNKQTNNALLSLPITPSAVYSSLLGNVAGMNNKGFELSMQGDIIRSRDFRWSASFNITWAKSLVTKLNPSADLSQIGNYSGVEYGNTALIQGQPLGLMTGMKVTGIIQNQEQLAAYKAKLGALSGVFPYLSLGDPMFLLDTVTYAAYGGAYPFFNTVIGNGAPKDYGGFTQEFTYKNFDLSFYFTFSQGGHLLWGEGVNSMEFNGTANADAVMLNRWTPEHTNTNQPRLLLGDGILYSSNLNVYSSSYIKLRTVTFNYRLNKSYWLKKAGVQTATAFVSATNLFTITHYPGLDPEVSDDPYSVGGGYFDISNYPATKTFSVGLKAAF